MTNTTYRLYGRLGSGSQMPQMLLEEIGAAYESVWVPRDTDTLPGYREINPTLKVPALRLLDGTTLFESAAICLHLAHAHPKAGLGRAVGTSEHARLLQWMVHLSTNVYESVLRIYHPDRYSADGAAAAEGIKRQAVMDYVRLIGLLAEQLDPFVLGGGLSAADFYLHVISQWHPDGRDATSAMFPRLAHHRAILSKREAVRKVEEQHAGW